MRRMSGRRRLGVASPETSSAWSARPRLSLPGQRAEWQPLSGWRLAVGAEEVDDLADGWLVGHHAGVALVVVEG
jgi:hypothetical protein